MSIAIENEGQAEVMKVTQMTAERPVVKGRLPEV
jgi:hypothetical protein